jgi:GTP-binding protein Era
MSELSRCGVVAIVGEPNAGKSTLINRLIGGKVSIVTPKVQTTRCNVRGVAISGDAQLVFIDTPGIFEAAKTFEKSMVQAAWAGVGDGDSVLLLIDAKAGLSERTAALAQAMLARAGKPVFLALNKIDRVKKEALMVLAQQCAALGEFAAIYMISAKQGDGTQDMLARLAAHMPQGPWLFPADELSDVPMRMLAAEITREKLFLKLEQELPYSIFVETESWEENEHRAVVSQVIYVEREGQKKIVIGEGGAMIKSIGSASRRELEKMLEKPVHVQLFVKVRPNWKNDSETYRLLGLARKE